MIAKSSADAKSVYEDLLESGTAVEETTQKKAPVAKKVQKELPKKQVKQQEEQPMPKQMPQQLSESADQAQAIEVATAAAGGNLSKEEIAQIVADQEQQLSANGGQAAKELAKQEAPMADHKLAVQHTLAMMKARQKEQELQEAAAEVIQDPVQAAQATEEAQSVPDIKIKVGVQQEPVAVPEFKISKESLEPSAGTGELLTSSIFSNPNGQLNGHHDATAQAQAQADAIMDIANQQAGGDLSKLDQSEQQRIIEQVTAAQAEADSGAQAMTQPMKMNQQQFEMP